MVAAAQAIATRADTPLIDDRFADPLVRADVAAADVDDAESGWKLEHMPAATAARTRFDAFFHEATADRRPVAVDLRHDWPAALLDAGFDAGAPTAWIAQGLFGYLPPDAQDRLLDNVTALSAVGSRLASEAIPPSNDSLSMADTVYYTSELTA